jgi:hypothetical protein
VWPACSEEDAGNPWAVLGTPRGGEVSSKVVEASGNGASGAFGLLGSFAARLNGSGSPAHPACKLEATTTANQGVTRVRESMWQV